MKNSVDHDGDDSDDDDDDDDDDDYAAGDRNDGHR